MAIAGIAAAALIFMAFRAGGFFPDTTALVALAMLAVLLGIATASARPLATLRPRLGVGVAALAAFAVWQLASSGWSHAPGRAALESGRTMLYLVVLLAGGLLVDRPARVRALVLGIVCGLSAACIAGLLSRTLPNVIRVAPDVASERLSWPVTYWNALGLMAAATAILCLGLTGGDREHRAVRLGAAGLVVPLVVTVYFTFSRGSIAAGAIAASVLVVLSRRRTLVGAALAVLPPAAVALVVAYHADALSRPDPTGPDAVSQGHRVILVVAGCTVAAVVLRALFERTVDRWLAARRPLPRRLAGGLWAVVVVIAVGGVAAGVATQSHRFLHGTRVAVGQDLRKRLTDPGNNGRLDHWRVAVKAFESDRLRGAGAGTYEVWWNRLRPHEFSVLNAHSLYVEELGETGLIGLALLVVALGAMLAGVVGRARGPDGAIWAAAAAAVVAWLLEAGIDWVWQMPVATAWVFALGGAALARPHVAGAAPARRPASAARLVAGLAVLLVAVTPVRIALSQAHLLSAIAALQRGDCAATVSSALSSAGALDARAEPYELLAYCDARLGFDSLAHDMIDRAIARDPDNWQYRYDLALIEAAARRDPRPAVAQARRLDPLNGFLVRFARTMATNDPQTWRRRALGARLLLPG